MLILKRTLLLVFLSLYLLTGCSLAGESTPATPTVPPVTPTPAATLTPTPPPLRAILLAPPETRAELVEKAQKIVQEVSAQAGYQVETLQTLQPQEITPQTKLIIALSLPSNLPDLLAAGQGTQFLVVSPADLGAGANLSVIRLHQEEQVFAAGYLSAVAARDWRAAAFVQADEPLSSSTEDAFRSGMGYFCGICNAIMPPVMRFPVVYKINPGSNAPVIQPVIDDMKSKGVNTIYVSLAVANPEIYQALSAQGFNLVGDQAPPNDVKARWVASLNMDIPAMIEQALPDILAGKGGAVLSPPVTISDINPELVSDGRITKARSVLEMLQKGLIYPFSVPGE